MFVIEISLIPLLGVFCYVILAEAFCTWMYVETSL